MLSKKKKFLYNKIFIFIQYFYTIKFKICNIMYVNVYVCLCV